MFVQQSISVGKLLLNVRNYRIVAQDSQKGARDAIISEQGKKLVVLARDILQNGLSPFDLPMVIDAEDGNGNFIMMEGNRRLTAIQLVLDPELARSTPRHAAFVKLHKNHMDAVPKVIACTIAPNRETAILWGNRKHASGLEGAGTEPWTTMAKARADKEQGLPTPALDVVNFVLMDEALDTKVRHNLEGSGFNLTTLTRLITTKELQDTAGMTVVGGKIRASKNRAWTKAVLTDVVSIISTGKKDSHKWTEREIDTEDKRKIFAHEIGKAHPRAKKAASQWIISGTPKSVPPVSKGAKKKSTPSTDEQTNLVPKPYKLSLPAGKINDIFIELKRLDVVGHRHAVSVLFRVFLEITLDEFIKKRKIQLPKDKQGRLIEKLGVRLDRVLKEIQKTGLLSEKELKPINVAISNKDDLLAPDTLNAYVHSSLMNPDPLQLKLKWANVQLFIERLWGAK